MLFPDNETPPDFGGSDFALPYHFTHRFRVQFEIGGSFGDGVGFGHYLILPFRYHKKINDIEQHQEIDKPEQADNYDIFHCLLPTFAPFQIP
jgi:hypothetical protein|nr:MAG TPA: hypothetical protein [Caudoviricetes sp.]